MRRIITYFCLILLISYSLVSAECFFTKGDSTDITITAGNSTTPIFKTSKNVGIKGSSSASTYEFASKHLNGNKVYLTSEKDNVIENPSSSDNLTISDCVN